MNNALNQKAFWILTSGSLMLAITLGIRHAFGVFLVPMSIDNGWGRETFGFAIALQNLIWGLSQPVVGHYADKLGAKPVMLVGGLLYALGLFGMATGHSSTMLIISSGFLIGIGLAGTTFPVIFGAISRVAPAEKRSFALGVSMSIGSLGQFVLLPLSIVLLDYQGWSYSLMMLCVLSLFILPLSFIFSASKNNSSNTKNVTHSTPFVLKSALNSRAFQLLCLGFFVCGFHVLFIATHLPGYLTSHGLSAMSGSIALALIGLFNIFGSYFAGVLGGRYAKPKLLSAIYFSRMIAIVFLLAIPLSEITVYLFAAMMGLLWLSTVPLTNGIVASLFGVEHMAMLGGNVFLSHQIGAFLGGWLGGSIYDLNGSYDLAWLIAIGLALFAAAVNLPIKEEAHDWDVHHG
jgi:MFS family permease